jgi:hypothetical protein
VNVHKEDKTKTIITGALSSGKKSSHRPQTKRFQMKNTDCYYSNIQRNLLKQPPVQPFIINKKFSKVANIQTQKLNKSQRVAPNPFGTNREYFDNTQINPSHENSYGFTNLSKDRITAAKDLTDC